VVTLEIVEKTPQPLLGMISLVIKTPQLFQKFLLFLGKMLNCPHCHVREMYLEISGTHSNEITNVR